MGFTSTACVSRIVISTEPTNNRRCCSSICIEIGNGNIIMFWFGQWRYLLQEFYILLERIILTVVYVAVILGLWLLTGIVFGFGIGNGNDIWFWNYSSNHRRGSWSIEIRICIENVIGFYFSFRYIFGNIRGIKNRYTG